VNIALSPSGADGWRSRRDAPLSASLLASIAFHIGLLVFLGTVLRPLPVSLFASPGAPTPLSAILVALRAPEAEKVPVRSEETPQRPTPIPPVVAPPRKSPVGGQSMAPAIVAAEPEFAPIGRISMSIGTHPRDFGTTVVATLAERFPYTPARVPVLKGGLSVMYPVKAARAGTSMKISALVLVDAGGNIAEIQFAPDDPLFAAAVIDSLRSSRFSPASFDGKPVPYWAILEFRFDIEGPTGPDGKRL